MAVTFDMTAARAKLQKLADGLKLAASGAVVDRAAAAIGQQIQAVARRLTIKHKLTGAASSGLTLKVAGGLVQLTSNRYLGYHDWWVFRSGMPPFVLSRASKIYAGELEAAISGKPSPLVLMDEAAEEAAAVKSRAKFQSDTAKIARRLFAASPAGKAKRAAARKEAAAKKKASGGGA